MDTGGSVKSQTTGEEGKEDHISKQNRQPYNLEFSNSVLSTYGVQIKSPNIGQINQFLQVLIILVPTANTYCN
jgi:hypothetical protein